MHSKNLKQGHPALMFTGIIVILILSIIISTCMGRYPLPVSDLFRYIFTGEANDPTLSTILLNVRLPRILGALLTGGVLAIAGATYQGIFRNPMVSPDILGISSGAGFGAALAILFSFNIFGIQLLAFAFGLGAVSLSYFISRVLGKNNDTILMLVLAGMVISSLFGAFLSLIKYVADPDSKLPAITFWLMGSLSSLTLKDILNILPSLTLGLVPLFLVGWRLNVLSFGEDEAKTLGVNTNRLRLVVIVASSLVTASIVSITGLIGWVGLIIPHFARFIIGPDHQKLLPFSFLLGALFMLWVDNISRSATTLEIPIGIITAIIGAPFFLLFLARTSNKSF